MRRLIFALPLLAAVAMPALAAGPDPVSDSLNAAWQRHQEDDGNLRNALVLVMQERAALRDRLAAVMEKCGAPCAEPAPQAQAAPPAAAPSTPEAPKPQP